MDIPNPLNSFQALLQGLRLNMQGSTLHENMQGFIKEGKCLIEHESYNTHTQKRIHDEEIPLSGHQNTYYDYY